MDRDENPLSDRGLLLENAGWLRMLAENLMRGHEGADDLLQETLEVALRRKRPPDFPVRFWLFGIMRNVGRLRYRGDRRRYLRELEATSRITAQAPPATGSPEAAIEMSRAQRLLLEAVRSLREPYQKTILLRYYEDLSAADIARRTGLPPATVRTHLKRGLDEIRSKLDQETGGDRRSWYVLLGPIIGVDGVRQPRAAGGPKRIVGWKTLSIGASLVVVSAFVFRGSSCQPDDRSVRASTGTASRDQLARGFKTGPPTEAIAEDPGAATTAAAEGVLYLSPSGNDRQAGTVDAPWKTFARAISALRPGETLVLKDGTYTPDGTGLPRLDCEKGVRSGTAGRPITVKAQHERKALLRPDGTYYALRIKKCAFWTFEGLAIEAGDRLAKNQSRTVDVLESQHITLKKLLISQAHLGHDEHALQIDYSSFVSVEDSEFYDDRAAAVFASVCDNCVFRRLYCNPRRMDSSGPVPGREGHACVRMYEGADYLLENVVSEGSYALATARNASRVRVLGGISIGEVFGFFLGGDDGRGRDSEVIHSVALRSRNDGLAARRPLNLWVRNVSVLGSNGAGLHGDCEYVRDKVYSMFVEKSLALGSGREALEIEQGPCFESSVDGSRMEKGAGRDLLEEIGPCTVSLPPIAGLRGATADEGTIGARIIYRYENGALTNLPLWSPAGAGRQKYRFAGCGAIVEGVNSDPATSCIGVHERLAVGAAGCPLPY